MLFGWVAPRVLLLAMALSSAGCSFIFVKPPPSVDPGGISPGPGKCTSSKVAPVLDTVFTALEGARIVYAASASDDTYGENQPLSRGSDIAFGAAFAALFLSSAVYGFVHTSHCSELRSGPPTVVRSRDSAVPHEDVTEKWDGDQTAPPPAPSTNAVPRQ